MMANIAHQIYKQWLCKVLTMPAGRPPFEITEEVIRKVEALAAQGLTQEQICSVIGICPDTLCRKKKQFSEFSDAINRGKHKGVATVTNALFNKAKKGDTACSIFYLKNRDNKSWQERPDKRCQFDYDPKAPLNVQAQQILKAASEGQLSQDNAHGLISSLSDIAKLEEFSEIRQELDEVKRLLNERSNPEKNS